MLTKKPIRERLLASTMICGALFAAAPVFAQDLPSAEQQRTTTPTSSNDPTEPQAVQEVVVTGSRLQQRDLTANSPVETVTAQDYVNTGTLTVETFLNQLPQVVPSVSTAANNPSANGAAFLNLRGLGTNRGLVLIDGRRIVGANSDNTVDVNIIPTALIARTEILTGGASATYGADAVAGVANFILKNDFEGVEADGQYLVSEHGDAAQTQASLTVGGNFAEGRGNAVLNFSYANREPLGKGQREFTAQAANTTSYFPSGTYRTAGNLPSQAAVDAVFGRYNVGAGAVQRTGGGTGFGFNGDGSLYATGSAGPQFQIQNFRRDPSEIATNFAPDFFTYNFEPDNLLILPLERQSFFSSVNYDVNETINVYGQALYTNYIANSALAPSPAPTGSNPLYPGQNLLEFTIPVTNPFIPADLATLLASRTGNNAVLAGSGATEEFAYRFRTNALGPRLSSNEVDVYNILVGTKLNLGGEWEGDIYYSQGRYDLLETQTGNLAVRRFENLLDSPTGGTEFCAGGFNPFGVGLSEACAAYVSVTAKNQQRIEQDNAVAVFSGPLFELPAGPIQVALGAEYRSIDFRFVPDSALQPGEVAGFNGQQPVSGFLDFYDLFGETSIPLLSDMPFAESVDLSLGYRFSDSNRTSVDHTYKAELSWVPVQDLRLRGTYQRAVRSPTVGELFAPQDENNPEVIDPCNALNPNGTPNTNRTAGVLAICNAQAAAAGFTPAFVQTYQQGNAQVNSLVGGNPELGVEKADTYTAGIVYRPDWQIPFIQNISASVDYYSIKIKDVVSSTDEPVTVARCYNQQDAANPNFDPNNVNCQRFRRSPGDFSIVDLEAFSSNQGLLKTSGVDVALNFETPLDAFGLDERFGTIRVGFIYTYVDEFLTQTSSADPILDYAGTIGDDYGDTIPQHKANLNLGYDVGRFGFDLRGRFIGAMDHEGDVPDEDPDATGVTSTTYWDLAARTSLTDAVELRAGVLNLFDKGVKEYDPFIDAQTDPSTYDVIGRRFYVGLNLRF